MNKTIHAYEDIAKKALEVYHWNKFNHIPTEEELDAYLFDEDEFNSIN